MNNSFLNLSPERAAIAQCLLIAYRRGLLLRQQQTETQPQSAPNQSVPRQKSPAHLHTLACEQTALTPVINPLPAMAT